MNRFVREWNWFEMTVFGLVVTIMSLLGFVGLWISHFRNWTVFGFAGLWVAAHLELEQWAQNLRKKKKKMQSSEAIPELLRLTVPVESETKVGLGEGQHQEFPPAVLEELYEALNLDYQKLMFLTGEAQSTMEPQKESFLRQIEHAWRCIIVQSECEDNNTHSAWQSNPKTHI